MAANSNSWFYLPFYRSLSIKVLLCGAPREIIGLNILVGILFIVNFHAWKILIVCALFHLICVYVCRSDDQMFDCLKMYIRKKSYYST